MSVNFSLLNTCSFSLSAATSLTRELFYLYDSPTSLTRELFYLYDSPIFLQSFGITVLGSYLTFTHITKDHV